MRLIVIYSVNTDLAKLQYNKTSGQIDLSGYSDQNNPYVFPHDGYVWVSSERLTSGEFQVVIRTANNTNAAPIYAKITSAYEIHSMFVKKGMKVFARSFPTGASLYYVPLTS